MTEAWVSVDAIVPTSGVAKHFVYRWIEAKHMPAHKIGKLWKLKLSEIDSWVRAAGADEPVAKSPPSTRKGKHEAER